MATANPERFALIDSVRGVAVLLMIVFHFCFDLRYFGLVEWDVPNGPGWWQFRYIILSLFIGTVGISMSLAQGRGFKLRSFAIRQGKLFFAALLISLMSLYMFPDSWIYFGILHFIFVASLICLPMVLFPGLSLILGLLIIFASIQDWVHPFWPFLYLGKYLPTFTEDFVPFFPWLGVSLLGVFLGRMMADKHPAFCRRSEGFTALVGRHALAIYLLHQPLLFAGFSSLFWLLSLWR